MNKEKSCKEQLLTRREVFQDKNLIEVEYLQQKELVVAKGGQRRVRNKLLMSGYLLVQVKMEEYEDEMGLKKTRFPGETFDLILGTPGIKFFVNCEQKKPIPFRPREIKRLFEMCDDTHLELLESTQFDYQPGDIVDVVDGAFAGYKAEVINVQGEKILAQLDMFGRIVPAEFTKEQLFKTQ